MATTSTRGMLRSLPALLALLVAFLAPVTGAPVTAPSATAGALTASAVHAPAVAPDPAVATPPDTTPPAGEPVTEVCAADGARVLETQDTAGSRSSRAPPAVTA